MRPEANGTGPTLPETDLPPEEDPVRLTGHGPFLFRGGSAGCLLIHGLTGTPEEMRYLGVRLHRDTGLTVSGVMLAGHGTDAETFHQTDWHDWYRSAEQAMLDLSRTCSPLFVAGFSMGGLIAMALALHRSDSIRALALLAAPLFANRHKALLAGLGYGLPGVRPWLRRRSKRTGWEAPPMKKALEPPHLSFAQLKWIMRRKGASLTLPTLILQSRLDPSVPWGNGIALRNLVSSRRKELILLARSQHVLPLDLERDRVADEIGRFFLSVHPPVRPSGPTCP